MRKSSKFIVFFICVLVMQMLAMIASAATEICTGLTASGGSGEASRYEVTATGKADDGCSTNGDSSAVGSAEMKLTNTSGGDGILSFTYTTTTGERDTPTFTVTSSVTGVLTLTNGASISLNVLADEEIVFSVATAKGGFVSSIALTNISFQPVQKIDIVCKLPNEGGSYTAGGTAVTVEQTETVSNTAGLTVVATANSDYSFVGWRNGDGKLLSTDLTYVIKTATTIYPDFISSSSPKAFQVKDGNSYYYWDDAFSAVGQGGTVILVANHKLQVRDAAYTVPAGVTFLIPYASEQYTIQGSSAKLPYANYGTQSADVASDLNPATQRYLELEVPKGCTIQSNGSFIVGGTLSSKAVGISGSCYGSHSNVVLNGDLNMGDNSILSTIGYILGSGHIYATGTGAKIYQPLIIMDYGGGGYTVGSAGKINNSDYGIEQNTFPSGEKGVFPFQFYTFQNIQARITLEYGNTLFAYGDMAAADPVSNEYIHTINTTTIIGKDTGLISLTGSASKVETEYLAGSFVNTADYKAVGRTKIDITGNASFGEMNIKAEIKVANLVPINADTKSSRTTFAIPYNYDITLKDGTFTVPNHLGILPGASVTVASGATLKVTGSGTRFIIYDGLNDHKSFGGASTTYGGVADRKYPTTAQLKAMVVSFDDSGKATAYNSGTGNLFVEGTLNIGSGVQFGGTVQTSGTAGTTPTIIVDANAVLSCTSQYGVVGSWSAMFGAKTWYHSGATLRTLTGQVMDANGNIVELVKDETYIGVDGAPHNLASYSYKLYTDSSDTSKYVGVGVNGSDDAVTTDDLAAEVLNASVVGSWCTEADHGYDSEITTAATCTTEGVMTYTCSACGHSYTESIAANGHDEVIDEAIEATCTTTGLTQGSHCSVCGEVIVEQQTVPTGACVDANADLQCDHCGAYLQVVLAGIEACYDAEVVLRYSLKIPQALLNNENAFVLLTKDSAWDGPVETKYTMAELKAAGVDKDGNYVVAAGTASGEMFRKVTLQVFENDTTSVAVYKQSDASAFESDPAYNVMYYGLATYTYGDEDQKVMMDALLTYGAYAQKKFGVDTENPVDSLLDSQKRTKPDLSTITQDTMTQVSQYDTNNIGIQIRSTEPNLDSRVYLRLAFATDANIDLANYTFELTYRDGNEKKTRTMTTEGTRPEVVYDAEKNVCYAMVYDIPAAYLDNMYTVTITNTTTNQSHSVSTSVICWARQVLIYSSDEATQNLAKALYLYNQAAKTFFKIQEIS